MRASATHGVALLLVLAVAVLVSSAATAMLVQSVSHASDSIVRRDADVAHALALASEDCARSWLESRADLVVLPPAKILQAVPVLRENIPIGYAAATIEVRAFDQYAMLPARIVASSTMVAGAMPSWLGDLARQLDGGADLLWINRPRPWTTHEQAARFPRMTSDGYAEMAPHTSIATLIASHNPAPASGTEMLDAGRNAKLNVNTAPIPILSIIARVQGLGGIEHIIQTREMGLPSSTRLLRIPDAVREETAVELVSFSDAWSFRIDVTFRSCRVSSWVTFVRGPEGWALAQRLPIDE